MALIEMDFANANGGGEFTFENVSSPNQLKTFNTKNCMAQGYGTSTNGLTIYIIDGVLSTPTLNTSWYTVSYSGGVLSITGLASVPYVIFYEQ